MKLGEHGSVALIDGVSYRQDEVPIEVVDTVGAGDVFVAGYLAELVGSRPAAERLATASTVGAFACLHIGDWEGFPTRAAQRRSSTRNCANACLPPLATFAPVRAGANVTHGGRRTKAEKRGAAPSPDGPGPR